MTKFVELTTPTGHAALINLDHVMIITPMVDGSNQTAIVYVNSTSDRVMESAMDILRMIEP